MWIVNSILKLGGKSSPLTRFISTGEQMLIRTTPVFFAEPLKKKKKLDPQIIKQREERRKKKLEKQIRRLEKNARQLKPIEELETPLELIDEKQKRARSPLVGLQGNAKKQYILLKKWARYKLDQKTEDFQIIDRLLLAQDKALVELRKESEDLYREAIQPVQMPFKIQGPVSTPPIEAYESPDGEYLDITKKWD